VIIGRRDVLAGMAATLVLPRPVLAATGRRLDFRFEQGLPDGVSLRRASPGFADGADGLLVMAAANQPRLARDPDSGRVIGLLIEGAATNYAQHSGGLTDRFWQAKGAARAMAAADIPAPDGTQNAARLRIRRQPGELGLIGSAGRIGSGEICCLSVYLRRGDAGPDWALNVYDYASYHGHFVRQSLGETWQRAIVPIRWEVGDIGPKLINLAAARPEAAAGELSEALAWGCQLEIGRSATSVIPTTDGPAERAADVVSFDPSALSQPAGVLRLNLPRGGLRGGTILDTEGAEHDGIRLGYSDSGWLVARIGGKNLAGISDATADSAIELAWNPRGVTLASGAGVSLHRHAEAGPPGPVQCGAQARLLARLDGTAPLNSVISALSFAESAPAITLAAAAPGFVPAGYALIFGDDFDDPDLSRINENAAGGRPGAPAWRSRYRQDRFTVINQEKQIYMDREFRGKAARPLGVQPFDLGNSVLTITADRADPVAVSPFILNFKYTSGCITSELTHWQTYGYFEMRARLPIGKGFFPAFWLLPKRVVWPPEIDIFESSGARPDAVHLGVILDKHRGADRWIEDVISIGDGFHVYALEWTREQLVWSLDGKPVWQQPNESHEDMYILANLALGNRDPKFIPDPDETTPFPGHFEIDYIRAYQRRTA
jgi:Glycosyl hydrolases family 16